MHAWFGGLEQTLANLCITAKFFNLQFHNLPKERKSQEVLLHCTFPEGTPLKGVLGQQWPKMWKV